MTEFIFLTSGPIDYRFANMSLYESICQASLGLRFPGLRRGAKEEIRDRIKRLGLRRKNLNILSASSRQTKETADEIGQILEVLPRVDNRLDAILFDFRQIMTEEEFKSLGDQVFDVARPRFLKAFFNNKLLESKLSVKKRIDSFLGDCARDNGCFLAVSHSFLMMVIKAYLTTGDKVFKDNDLLDEVCQPEKRPFGFLTGFKLELTQDLKVKSLKMLK